MRTMGVNDIRADAIPVSVMVMAIMDNPTPKPGPKKEPTVMCFMDPPSLVALTNEGHFFRTVMSSAKNTKPVMMRICVAANGS